ncbi:MAG: DUF1731 domain-containing protein [Armatimonadetes bacterium]|nr:DUF1731 domain-containing protein [Armatimonadota bacterium]
MSGTIVIAGGIGFLGGALKAKLVEAGCEVVMLSRRTSHEGASTLHTPNSDFRPTTIVWDAKTLGSWTASLEGATAVINLAGRSIDCRFTPENRRQILESRVESTKVIGQAIAACKEPPKVWLQASAIGVYGDGGDWELDEGAVPFPATPRSFGEGVEPDTLTRFASLTDLSPKGRGGLDGSVTAFMATSCRLWEAACAEAETPYTRKVVLRTAVVLSRHSGAFPKLWRLTRLGLGGAAGSGKQFFSWIHVEDWVRAVLFLLDNSGAEGPFNLAAPEPVRNKNLMATLRNAAHRPWSPPVPVAALRIGSALMGTEAELILQSQRVIPFKLIEVRFQFDFPKLEDAIQSLTSDRN